METYYTVRELSEKYDIPISTIRKWIYDGKLKLNTFYKKKIKRGYAASIRESDFEHFLGSNKQQRESYMLKNYKGFHFKFSSENQYKKARFIDCYLKKDTGESIKDYLDFVVNEAINDLYDDIKTFEE